MAAHKRGDHATAAAEFTKADELAPSPVALQAALDAAVDADDPVLGSELLERSRRGPVEGALSASVGRAREKLGGRAGRVVIKCPSEGKCMGAIDGKPADTTKTHWVRVGQHAVLLQLGNDAQQKIVDVAADQTVEVAPTATPPPVVVVTPVGTPAAAPAAPLAAVPPAAPAANPPATADSSDRASKGISPVYFWAGVGATLAFGVAATAASFYTKSRHDKFVSDGCERANAAGCTSLSSQGSDAQLVTNVLFIGTGVVAVATVVIGVGFVSWDRGRPTAFVLPGGGGAGWSQRF